MAEERATITSGDEEPRSGMNLSPSEARELEEHLRPLVERGEGGWRLAVAYLWAS